MMITTASITVLLVAIAQCGNDERHWNTVEKNGVRYGVLHGSQFSITNLLRVLNESVVAGVEEEMESLSLHHTGIERIEPGTFRQLSNLRSFVVSAGNLRDVPSGIFNGVNISKLVLKDCAIRAISPDAFDSMTRLKEINLEGNRLKRWLPAWFANTPALTAISMGANLIEEIPAGVLRDSNGSRRFRIILQRNGIRKVDDDAFVGVKRIECLLLGGNRLEEFDGKCLAGVDVEELGIDGNRISCLSEEHFGNVFAARSVNASGNPWSRQCLGKMKKWVREHQKDVIF